MSYRDVEELLAECGVEVDHVTVFRLDTARVARRRSLTELAQAI
jgi:transposase-like protein